MQHIARIIAHRNGRGNDLERSSPQVVAHFELGLYCSAQNYQEYTNLHNLETRLENHAKLMAHAAAQAMEHRNRIKQRHALLRKKLGDDRILNILKFIEQIEKVRRFTKESIKSHFSSGTDNQIVLPPTILKLFYSTPLVDRWNMIYSKSPEVDNELLSISQITWVQMMREAKENLTAHRDFLRASKRSMVPNNPPSQFSRLATSCS
eukprot:CAMPEP_0198293352 /NCGR_PEP_ID=MMETSP1449-20131203/16637_1 /TAXON_ID=420275 /ORGANISM="Attheya septentrionalis, Strain CCMP2084" /LENGTH=206 /DNA_ID=CAMNT_0043992901 /DNA_START=349 /DNA_END=969 /DNA_ORIENTATION=+